MRRRVLLRQTSPGEKWGYWSNSVLLSLSRKVFSNPGDASVNLQWVIYCFFGGKIETEKSEGAERRASWLDNEKEREGERAIQPVSICSVYGCHNGAIINWRAQVLIQQTALWDWPFGRKRFGPNQGPVLKYLTLGERDVKSGRHEARVQKRRKWEGVGVWLSQASDHRVCAKGWLLVFAANETLSCWWWWWMQVWSNQSCESAMQTHTNTRAHTDPDNNTATKQT